MEGLLGRAHNPDVLTCIANLSNDEVFTPPEMASAMLDMVAEAWAADHGGENLWANPDVTFLDPFTKTGVFLREITRRLVEGLRTCKSGSTTFSPSRCTGLPSLSSLR